RHRNQPRAVLPGGRLPAQEQYLFPRPISQRRAPGHGSIGTGAGRRHDRVMTAPSTPAPATTMRAAILGAAPHVPVEDVPRPVPGAGEAVIDIKASGIVGAG